MSINNSHVVCSNGHIWDTSTIVDDPQVRGHIVQCPMPVNGAECGARIIWKNPIPLTFEKSKAIL